MTRWNVRNVKRRVSIEGKFLDFSVFKVFCLFEVYKGKHALSLLKTNAICVTESSSSYRP